MSRVRYRVEGHLDLLSPLHVGSGEDRFVRSVKGKETSNQPPLVAAIVREARGQPYLPPTTIKGLLRRLGETVLADDPGRLGDLFGDLDKGKAGMVLARGGELKKAARTAGMPFVEGAESLSEPGGLGPGVFVAARTAILAEKGVALDHTLHHMEMVAPGARFALHLVIETRGADAVDRASDALHRLVGILDRLTDGQGHAIGRGAADGFGRVRLEPESVRVHKRAIERDGRFPESDVSHIWRRRTRGEIPASEEIAAFTLIADGPFLVVDGSRRPRARQEPGHQRPQLAAQRTADDLPLILGSSASGALRSRARWLAALSGDPNPDPDGVTDIADLTAVQRLFGTQRFKGLLTIELRRLDGAPPQLWTAASVKIDRFTGGPIQNALFHTEAFVGTRLGLTLRLDPRPGRGEPTEADRALFARLVADLRDNGLMLGHGSNKGYGWFRAEAA